MKDQESIAKIKASIQGLIKNGNDYKLELNEMNKNQN